MVFDGPGHRRRSGENIKQKFTKETKVFLRALNQFKKRNDTCPELANYKRLRELADKWVGLSFRLAKEKRKPTA